MIRLLTSTLPLPVPQPLVSLSQSSCVSSGELTDGRVGDGVGEKPNHKVWHSINYSILSGHMLLYAVGQEYLVDATAEVAGGEKAWHSINHSILSGLMLLYAVGQKYLVDATAEVAWGEKLWHSINH
jgi:hypothetical protein